MPTPVGFKPSRLTVERRKLTYMSTMLEQRKKRFKEQLAADEWKVNAHAAKVAEMEAQQKAGQN